MGSGLDNSLVNINWVTVLISFLVATFTTITTSVLNWLLWRVKFGHQEKQEYRKIYITKKLEVYEKLIDIMGGDGLNILPFLPEKKDSTTKPINNSHLLNMFLIKAAKYYSGNHLFISKTIQDKSCELFEIIAEATEAYSNGKMPNSTQSEYISKLNKLKKSIAQELGIDDDYKISELWTSPIFIKSITDKINE